MPTSPPADADGTAAAAAAAAAPGYDPFDPAVRRDPYPAYRALRADEPVWRHPRAGLWFLARHADCVSVLHDRRFSAQEGQRLRRADGLPPSMLSTDPPEHTRLRQAVQGELHAPRLAPLAGRVRAATEALAGRWDDGVAVDGVHDLAVPLAVDALGGLLGVPVEDRERFAGWAMAVAPLLDPLLGAAERAAADEALGELLEWVADRLGERRRHPTDDVLGALVRAHADGRIAAGEALTTCSLLVIGGFEPLVDLLSTTLGLVLGDGGPLGRREAGWWRAAVEEALRHDAPIAFAARVPVEDAVVAGHRIPAGEPVVALLASANRDGTVFPEGDRFRPARHPNPHLSFGAGPHHCLGATFARIVARSALGALSERLPGLALAGPPSRRDSLVPRGLASLPLEVRRQ